jgi:hypothetical protein
MMLKMYLKVQSKGLTICKESHLITLLRTRLSLSQPWNKIHNYRVFYQMYMLYQKDKTQVHYLILQTKD